MAKIRSDQPLIPSLLDRLIDEEPETKREAPRSRNQILREMKKSVRRDVEDLLNTRRSLLEWPSDLTELESSLLNYGIPDITRANMSSPDVREQFRKLLEKTIQQNEPRLQSVRVHLISNNETLDRTLRFRIDALLRADPAPEPVVFDSVLEPGTGTVAIHGESE